MYIIKNQLPSVLYTLMCSGDDHQCVESIYADDAPWYFNGNIVVIVVVIVVVVPLASLKSIEFLGM